MNGVSRSVLAFVGLFAFIHVGTAMWVAVLEPGDVSLRLLADRGLLFISAIFTVLFAGFYGASEYISRSAG